MSKTILMAFLAMVLFASVSQGQEPGNSPYITVAGFAEDWIDPDVAVWSITIAHNGKDLTELKEFNDREYERVLAMAAVLGLPDEHLSIGRIGVTKVHKKDKHYTNKEFSHFRMSRQIKIEQHDIGRFEEFLDLLLIEGDLNVNLSYALSTIASVRSRLKVEAAKAANDKAHRLAHELGAVVADALIISEYPIIAEYQQIDHLSKQSGRIPRPTPEKIHVREQVYVRFAIEARDCYAVHP